MTEHQDDGREESLVNTTLHPKVKNEDPVYSWVDVGGQLEINEPQENAKIS